MAFVTSSLKDQLQKISCHFTWNLEDGTIREINDLTNRVEFDYNNDPDKQKVPKLSLLGYLSVSSLHKKRNSSKAIKHLKEALMSNDEEIHKGEGARGDRMVILGDLAWIYFKQGKNDDARDYIQKVNQLLPLSQEAQAQLWAHEGFASWWFGANQFERARMLYDAALELDPDNEPWLFELGLILDRQSRQPNGENAKRRVGEVMKKVITLNPKRSLARVIYAIWLFNQGQREKYPDDFNKAIKTSPNDVTVLQRIGQFLRKQGFLDEALKRLESLLHDAPKSSFLKHQLCLVYRDKYFSVKGKRDINHLHRALEFCTEAVEDSSGGNFPAACDQAYLTGYIGKFEHDNSKIDKANDLYSALIETENLYDKASAHQAFGNFHKNVLQNTSNAIEQYQIAVKVKPDSFAARKACQEILKMMKERTDVDSLKLQASAYNNLGEIDSALSKYEQAYQAENSPDTAAELASIYLSKLDIDMADRYIQVLSNDDNLSGEYSKLKGRYHFVKGTLLTQSKKLRDARTEFSKSLDFNYLPGVQPLLDILAQCKDDEKFELEWFEDCAKIMYVTDDKNCTDEGRNELEQYSLKNLPAFSSKTEYICKVVSLT
ncbi:interferon-induced protein with tetratricopeptide repeats 5-like isoform X2 [Ptychodera flava]|uniref:interferon-induced protein with tetratricopeptide repeats 5-like isoform X2 n=1 Tax=Ptychodera flava TaxID=63121 RepID=UPI00396A0F8D